MIKKMFILFIAISCSVLAQDKVDLTRYVNPMIGTGGHGHTFPGATLPFGMVQLSPDTDTEGWDWCSGYHYSDNSIMGFSHTHLSGTGLADYGDILVMPSIGDIKMQPGSKENPDEGYRSRFSHENEIAEPGYYSVVLDDYNIKAELTTTERVGFHKYTFPKDEFPEILFDLKHGIQESVIETGIQLVDSMKIIGYRKSRGSAEHTVYFAAKFSVPFSDFALAKDDSIHRRAMKMEGENIKAFFRFGSKRIKVVEIQVGISQTSMLGAIQNLETEGKGKSFDSVKSEAQEKWNNKLNRIIVEGGSEDQKTIFYTALYHSLLCPNLLNDVNKKYIGMDGEIHSLSKGNMYTVFSLWDTFRSTHPLFTIIEPELAVDLVNSLLRKYDEKGMLPVWELASNETFVMIAYHSVSVIADAIMKDLGGFDVDKAYKAMKHSAEMDIDGLKYYKELGYIPSEIESESVSKLLEYCYDDWCIAQVAKKLGKDKDYQYFLTRSKNYLNVFDDETKFMRAIENGDWKPDFNPNAVSSEYTEANAWQYTFFVPHDVAGLINEFGGDGKFIRQLDSMFSADSKLGGHFQPDVSGLIGQYAHGNEPSHHVAYLYNYAGAPWKTQERVRYILDKMYSNAPDGLSGNEDCGQMSSWLVFSAMGMYPVCPGDNQYIFGSPLFDKVTINLSNDEKFVIESKNNSHENVFITNANLNGNKYSKSYITHDEIVKGGRLIFTMGSTPSNGGFREYPLSDVETDFVQIPLIKSSSDFFNDSLKVSLVSRVEGAKLYYTLDGSDPSQNGYEYSSPFTIEETTEVKAVALINGNSSKVVTSTLHKYKNNYEVVLNTEYSERYSGGGATALVNEVTGTDNFKSLPWQGYEGVDLDAIIDLNEVKNIQGIYARFLENQDVWIFQPRRVEFLTSVDGETWDQTFLKDNGAPVSNRNVEIKKIGLVLDDQEARYIHIKAENVGYNPEWHRNAGGKSWLFIDEVIIQTDEKERN